MKILFYDTKSYDRDSFQDTLKDFPGVEIEYTKSDLDPRTAALAEGFDAVCAFVSSDVGVKTVEILHNKGIGLILMRCAGFNNVDMEASRKYGIRVMRVPGYSPEAVAEHAMALALAANRRLYKAYNKVRENDFSLSGLMGFNFYEKTAGIIGTGKIGRVFIDICRGFGMNVIAYDLYPAENSGINYVSKEELFRNSDIISLHCPLTEQTRYIIDEAALRLMKKSALIVNTSRGHLIDSEALLDALNEKRIGGAALDVYEEESGLFFEDNSDKIVTDEIISLLVSRPNVIVTSHQAFLTEEALANIAEVTLKNLDDYLSGKELVNEVK